MGQKVNSTWSRVIKATPTAHKTKPNQTKPNRTGMDKAETKQQYAIYVHKPFFFFFFSSETNFPNSDKSWVMNKKW